MRNRVTRAAARLEAQRRAHPPAFIFQFKNPLILLLLASALVSILTKNYEDAISITVVSARRPPGVAPAPRRGCPGDCRGFAYLLCKEKRAWLLRKKGKCSRKKEKQIHVLRCPQGVSGSMWPFLRWWMPRWLLFFAVWNSVARSSSPMTRVELLDPGCACSRSQLGSVERASA